MPRRLVLALALIAATALFAGCSSATSGQASLAGSSPTNAGAAATAAPSSSAPATARGTQEIILRPLNSRLAPTSGYTISSEYLKDSTIECDQMPAQSAVNDDIQSCSPTAASAHTCWPAPNSSNALCLMNPFKPVLYLLSAGIPLGAMSAPRVPVPLGLELTDGTQCILRNGGAWSSHKSGASAAYGCGTTSMSTIVWSGAAGPIDKSEPDWTVQIGQPEDTLQTVKVTKAYFVGTA